ncbi:MAG TPA: DUF4383 domain-containing protein [Chloroflexia bacterium]|nr:DUF4383 domain-containing protein [Chloroflexia bacterium]
MYLRYATMLIGATYLAFGLLGFLYVDAINPIHHNGVGARYLLNLIAINELHNIVHLAVGVTGLWAATSLAWSRRWGLIVGAVLLVLFIVGMVQAYLQGFPNDQMLLGLVPLNSPGHILHMVTGGLALYIGLVPLPEADTATSDVSMMRDAQDVAV